MMRNEDPVAYFEDWARTLLRAESPVLSLPPLPGAALALLIRALSRVGRLPLALVADGVEAMDTCLRDLYAAAPPDAAAIFRYAPRDTQRHCRDAESIEEAGERWRALTALRDAEAAPPILVTCVSALLQYAPDPAALRRATAPLAVGDRLDRDTLLRRLTDGGYESVPEVDRKGAFAVRGGLVDLWSPQDEWPCRIEFCDDAVESLRTFDPATQRSRDRLARAAVFPTPAWEASAAPADGSRGSLAVTEHFPPSSLWLWLDADTHEERAAAICHNRAETCPDEKSATWSEVQAAVAARPGWRHFRVADCADGPPVEQTGREKPDAEAEDPLSVLRSDMLALSGLAMPGAEGGAPPAPDVREAFRASLIEQCFGLIREGQTVVFSFDTQGGLDHFRKQTAERAAALKPRSAARRLILRKGSFSEGFSSRALGLTLVAEADLYGRSAARRLAPGRSGRKQVGMGERLGSWTDMGAGDLVVHALHGVGRYLGLFEIVFQGQRQEVLTVEYADGAKLHVPVSQAHLLSRYVGLSRRQAQLHRLGGSKWKRDKEAARRAIYDMAAQLLETQARRDAHPGHVFRPDHPWQREFEASFPFRETPDQERAIAEVKADMESARPMDRLLCGDAGYGKTEVAIRAAFKASLEERQTAVLVPTTVLAQQHFEVFRERMAPYPIRVEMLSRFCGARRQTETLAALADGSADVVIGTHALLQPGVRFKDLGLVVIDEEQRFGVRHKEWFKHLRSQVDVLTLTATPIPRTLYMSLTGARDMSLLQTPPSERLAIETRVAPNTDDVVRSAVLRELNRNGQVFYLHNRVMTMERMRRRLERLVPEARLIVAHGQMPTHALEDAMRRFTQGEYDVLLCTTIIESGLDIPAVNTILIDRADRFGIADLYQLRGRVGRSRHQGYAYLLLPPGGVADGDARERIRALREHAHLGEGFKLAVRDLEIRGAGNVLGAQQSGHIAAIGFELYCQMLQHSVADLKNETPPPIIDAEVVLDFISATPYGAADEAAYIPASYIEQEKLRIGLYRSLAQATSENALSDLRLAWSDRFGAPPVPVERLLKIARIRIMASRRKVRRVETRGDHLILISGETFWKPNGRFPGIAAPTADGRLDRIVETLAQYPAPRANIASGA
jgi:transcription-repair coupling factor (superfamily II helicase)